MKKNPLRDTVKKSIFDSFSSVRVALSLTLLWTFTPQVTLPPRQPVSGIGIRLPVSFFHRPLIPQRSPPIQRLLNETVVIYPTYPYPLLPRTSPFGPWRHSPCPVLSTVILPFVEGVESVRFLYVTNPELIYSLLYFHLDIRSDSVTIFTYSFIGPQNQTRSTILFHGI